MARDGPRIRGSWGHAGSQPALLGGAGAQSVRNERHRGHVRGLPADRQCDGGPTDQASSCNWACARRHLDRVIRRRAADDRFHAFLRKRESACASFHDGGAFASRDVGSRRHYLARPPVHRPGLHPPRRAQQRCSRNSANRRLEATVRSEREASANDRKRASQYRTQDPVGDTRGEMAGNHNAGN